MNTLYIKLVDNDNKGAYCKGITNYGNDCGFDLYCPENLVVPAKAVSFKVDLKIQTMFCDSEGTNIGYMLLPRSSMGAKTPLRLCNSVGIIDPGYRGNVMMFVDNVSDTEYTITRGDRIGQVVSFSGKPTVCRVTDELPDSDRGSGGFGSTGR